MSDTQSNESQLLRGAVKPTLIVGAIAIVLFTLIVLWSIVEFFIESLKKEEDSI